MSGPTPTESSRAAAVAALDEGNRAEAAAALRRILSSSPSLADAQFVLSRLKALGDAWPTRPYRVAIVRSFTVEPVLPFLQAAALVEGIDLKCWIGEFGAYSQEIIDPSSRLYEFAPDAVVVATQTRDVAPTLWAPPAGATQSALANDAQAAVERAGVLIAALRRNSSAAAAVHNFDAPASPAAGLLDVRGGPCQFQAIAEANRLLAARAMEQPGVVVLDYDGLVARVGRENWRDERRWLTARLPIAAPHLHRLAIEWLRVLLPLSGRACKAIVVDLDNTLWGGVVGEEGLAGLKLGGEYPGAAYLELQRALIDLRARGILLAVCSKNNLADAMEAIDQHPEMLLRSTDFAAMRANWLDKAANLRAIASELNIGTDALAFVDDNPVERAHVRRELPEVHVLELPPDPMAYADIVRGYPAFERLGLSHEDTQRADYYRQQQERAVLQQEAGSVDDFLRSLGMTVRLLPASAITIPRIAQLTQKTNQFNLTTRRYTEAEVAAMASSSEWRVWAMRSADRFGDNGIVGVAILRIADEAAEIDTFLLSCRVIGRTLETALLAHALEDAASHGAEVARAWFLPSAKNGPSADFYERHGFAVAERTDSGTLWETSLPSVEVGWPQWVAREGETTDDGI